MKEESKKIRVALVGCGSIASVHVWALAQLEQIELVATVDIIPERAAALAAAYEKALAEHQERVGKEVKTEKELHPVCYTSLTEMLQKEKPAAVHICTPHYLHVPMAIECMKQGVAVFSEKPPAITREQLMQLKKVTEETGINIGFCFQNRYNRTMEELREMVAKGDLGQVIGARGFVTWRRDEDYYESPWKGRIETEGGGALMNQSIHTLDLLLEFLGKPQKVEASLNNHHLQGKVEVEDTVEAWMEFADEKRACLYASTAYAGNAPVFLEYQLEKGTITVLDHCLLVSEEGKDMYTIDCREKAGIGKDYWGNGHLKCITDYYQCMCAGKKFRNNLQGVVNTVETVLDIYDCRV